MRLLTIGILLTCSTASGSDERPKDSFRAGSIYIVGNTVTPYSVIRSQVHIIPDMLTTKEDIRKCEIRLRRIGLFQQDTGRLIQPLGPVDGFFDILILVEEHPRNSILFNTKNLGALEWDGGKWDKVDVTSQVAKPGPEALKQLWADLAAKDHAKAFCAICSLANAPDAAIPFIAKRLSPVRDEDPTSVAKWISELGSSRFSIRQRAMRQLTELGPQVERYLIEGLPHAATLEVRRRLSFCLKTIRGNPPANTLRSLRAMYALELMDEEAAQRLIESLAHGAEAAYLTRAAQAALSRRR